VGGTLMTVGHLAFAAHVYVMVKGRGPVRATAPWAERATTPAEVAS
jgi:hypothetical protein